MADATYSAATPGATAAARDIGVPAWLALGLPLAYLAIIFTGRALGDDFYNAWIYGERGVVELSTAAMSLTACGIAIAAWRQRARLPHRYLGVWLAIFAAGAFYFGAEELSWGQQLLRWDTPEAFQAVNDHNETNLHNMTPWADEKPKQVVDMSALIGGIILPLVFYFRRVRFAPSDWKYWFFPTLAVTPACLCAVVLKNFERLRDLLKWYPEGIMNFRMSEPQEMYFAMFFLLYALSFYLRVRRHT